MLWVVTGRFFGFPPASILVVTRGSRKARGGGAIRRNLRGAEDP